MPSLTPSQRVFGVGLTPIERAFRPPQGMENDPAYNDYARRKFAAADMEDAQRGQVQEALASQEDARAQRAQDRQMQDVEQRATEALRGKSPEEIPNILAQFPELARSRNLGGFTNFAQAVTPSAGQRTLAPSLRSKLPPAAVPYFEKRFSETGDALDAKDYAERVLDQEKFVAEALPDIMAGGGTMEDVQKIRSQIDLGPIERAAFRESWKRRGASDKDDFRAQKLKGLLTTLEEDVPEINSDPNIGPIVTMQDILNKKAANYDLAHKIVYPEKYQQPQAPVAPTAQAASPTTQGVAAPQISQVPVAPVQSVKPISAAILAPEEEIKKLEELRDAPIAEDVLPLVAFQKRKELNDQIAQAKEALDVTNVARKYVEPVYNEEKQAIESAVDKYAKAMKIPAQSVWNAIANDSPLPVMNPDSVTAAQMVEGGDFTFDPKSDMIIGRPSAVLLGATQELVNPKFQSALQELKAANAKSRPVQTFFRSIGGEFSPPTRGKVLAEYAKSKVKPVETAQKTNSAQPPVAKIKSVKQIE